MCMSFKWASLLASHLKHACKLPVEEPHLKPEGPQKLQESWCGTCDLSAYTSPSLQNEWLGCSGVGGGQHHPLWCGVLLESFICFVLLHRLYRLLFWFTNFSCLPFWIFAVFIYNSCFPKSGSSCLKWDRVSKSWCFLISRSVVTRLQWFRELCRCQHRPIVDSTDRDQNSCFLKRKWNDDIMSDRCSVSQAGGLWSTRGKIINIACCPPI